MGRTSIGTRLGARIRAQRSALGWSQAKLAEVVELTPNYLGSLERGEALPTVQTLVVVARALGVSPSRLLGDEEATDDWLDRLLAIANTVPNDRRPLALAVLRVIAATGSGVEHGTEKPTTRKKKRSERGP